MTTIRKDDYVFEVDADKTAEYYLTHSLCECQGCRNYYAQIKGKFPKLEAFLSCFGVDISKPDEVGSLELDHTLHYLTVDYTVCGRIVSMGQHGIDIQDDPRLILRIYDGFVSPHEQTGEYFTFSIENPLGHPWTLDKPRSAPMQKIKPFLKKLFKI